MYQRILNLLNIRGYQKEMTPLGPCYVKEDWGRKKGVFIAYEHKPDGSLYTTEETGSLNEELKQYIGPKASVLVLILSEQGRSTWTDPDRAFEELYDPVCMILSASDSKDRSSAPPEEFRFRKLKDYQATAVILTINIFMYLWSAASTEILNWGALTWMHAFKQGELYRLVTSNFLHNGFDHLFNNMIVFVLIGSRLEPIFGRARYVALYMGAGLCGSIVSAVYYMNMGEMVASVGASGAIFGLIGAMLWILIKNRGYQKEFYGGGVALMIAGSLYHGFSTMGVDNAAHIGGCIGGFFLAILLYRQDRGK
ncbi:rhomboid family intramembrane serine protease [Anaerostipes caccae]|uniref:rhomboid family intramembrane serine protease n=1 Tax=Anaerostipes caccae TaxID=105841 RepID=UPI00241F021F|nr:rhomboid family intramembrane serine protease [Anaerostipes caccae]